MTKTKDDSNTLIGMGAGVGVLGAIGAFATGAICPLCIFAVPALVGTGIYQKFKAPKESQIIIEENPAIAED